MGHICTEKTFCSPFKLNTDFISLKTGQKSFNIDIGIRLHINQEAINIDNDDSRVVTLLLIEDARIHFTLGECR